MNNIKKQFKFLQSYNRIHASIFRAKDVVNQDVLVRMQGYTQLRTDYVLQENWPIHSSGIDIDMYDQKNATRYVVATIGSHVVAGMRLTPVRTLEESLSFHMWDSAADRESFSKQLHASREQAKLTGFDALFDVSRLVTESSILKTRNEQMKYDSRAGLMKILALATSIQEEGKTPVWIFTTTESVLNFMKRNHFQVLILAEGVITEGDMYTSYLCYVRPHDVIRNLKRNNPLLYLIAARQTRKIAQ